ncbi:MAG: hypothetical protein HPY73_07645 [Methanomassiliicoccales archaeon]|nr:MAG: hypothetical protein HPY73_07645 [Methanomassiliicoccales archaeon]
MTVEPSLGLRIPSEIFRFFNAPGGHSLIVRGGAGTGKTTFALQVIEDLSRETVGYYLSTRVSDRSLLTQFPWLKERLIYDPVRRDEHVMSGKKRSGLAKLKGINIDYQTGQTKEMSISIGRQLTDLECIYQLVEADRIKRMLFVIDSVDAMAEKYGLDQAMLIASLQKDLVEGYGQNVLYVLESPEQLLDYLGDGVVVISASELDKRRVREIELVKLRGCEILRPRYLFTLKGGQMLTFDEKMTERANIIGPWSPIKDSDGKMSTGMADVDRMVGGGIERGSIILIEIGHNVPLRVAEQLERSFVANFVSLGRGVLWFPSRRSSAESIRSQMLELVPKEIFDRQVRIPEVASQVEISAPYIMPVEGTNAGTDLKWRSVSYMLSNGEQPYLSVLGFDTLESIYGEKVVDQIMDHLGAMKKNNGVCLCVASSSTVSKDRLADMAYVHVKLDKIGGTTIMYGIRPFTECNAVTFQSDGHKTKVVLTQVV